jgi:lipoic acid synthetase
MINRLPAWFKQALPDQVFFQRMKRIAGLKLNTVCKSARCPNITDCMRSNQVTFMILGNACTRSCRFCAVEKTDDSLLPVTGEEPGQIARMVKELGLRFVVITSVTRDDLTDGGAGEFARVVESVHGIDQGIKIEILIPDFLGNIRSLETITLSCPDVIGHNLETVQRLYADLRPQALYQLSLSVLAKIKELNPQVLTKSSLMLGLGEKEDEVVEAMKDLRFVGCDILTLGQYLAPSEYHYQVKEFISPEQFQKYRDIAFSLGFKAVLSEPKARSSYQADKLFKEANLCMI